MKKIISLLILSIAFVGFSSEAYARDCKPMDSDNCNTYNGTGGCRQWVASSASACYTRDKKGCECKETYPGYYMSSDLDIFECPIGSYCPGHVGAGGKTDCTGGKTTCQSKSQNSAQCVSPASCTSSSTGDACVAWKANYDTCPVEATSCSTCKSNGKTRYVVNSCKQGTSLHAGDYTCHPIDCGSHTTFTNSSISNCSSVSVCWKNNATAWYCNQCNSGYLLVGGGCGKACEAGYFLPSYQAGCQNCPQNAYCPANSTSPTSCNTVGQGYVTDHNKAKTASECHSPSTNGTTTSEGCPTGNTTVFSSCPTLCNCAECNQNGTKKYYCTSCKDGGSFRTSDYTCQELSCPSGKTLSSSSYIANCAKSTKCFKDGTAKYYCDQCNSGYTLNSNGTCSGGSTLPACPGPDSGKQIYATCPTPCASCTKCARQDNGQTNYYCANCKAGVSFTVETYTCTPINCPSGVTTSTSSTIAGCSSTGVCWANNNTAYYCKTCNTGYTLTSQGTCTKAECTNLDEKFCLPLSGSANSGCGNYYNATSTAGCSKWSQVSDCCNTNPGCRCTGHALKGYYWDKSVTPYPTKCPGNQTTDGEGATSVSQCHSIDSCTIASSNFCLPYSPANSCKTYNDDEPGCVWEKSNDCCQAGLPGGYDSGCRCTKVNPGYHWTSQDKANGISFPVLCEVGYYCLGGDNDHMPCPEGKYSPSGAKSEDECVVNCPTGQSLKEGKCVPDHGT
ncbi:MAG: hypothetical protein MJ247_05955, partial [Alphaproteobacteria bacterium]|nr:hypothetical protein [Alphaproteobacteria bacterium]